jgi:hypothetical protein
VYGRSGLALWPASAFGFKLINEARRRNARIAGFRFHQSLDTSDEAASRPRDRYPGGGGARKSKDHPHAPSLSYEPGTPSAESGPGMESLANRRRYAEAPV